MRQGAYRDKPHKEIVATLALLKHFRAFLASECRVMHDPYSGWMKNELDKPQARKKLQWLINVAINRKAGIPDHAIDWEVVRLADAVNTPRLRIYERNCPKRYRARLAHRLVSIQEEEAA